MRLNTHSENSSPALKHIGFFVIFLLIFFSSCKKFVAIPPPKNEIVTATAFKNDQSARSTVAGLYSEIMQSNLFLLNGAMSLFPGLSADELYTTSPNPMIAPFADNKIPANDYFTIYNRLWRWGYKYIYHINTCLEGLSSSTTINSATKKELTGEVKVVRALCYFYLTNLFGAVPLETTTDYQINAKMPRTHIDKIYQQIIADLTDAKNLLKTDNNPDHTIPGRWASAALLSRVYLYQKDWQKAESLSSSVIESGSFQLEEDPNQVFVSTSRETIWQLKPVAPFFNTAEGYTFIPANKQRKPLYALTSYQLEAFKSNDLRRMDWIDSVIIDGETYYYPYKYKIRSGTDKIEYNIVLRLAEQYLIRAEARAHQNKLQEAISDLNVIRQRAGLYPLTNTLDQDQCLTTILKERQRELFAEWGHRWFDLKRTENADSILRNEKIGWESTATLYPIPLSQLEDNPFLTQNPGY